MLTGFQLRAARAVLNVFTKDLGESIGLHYSTLIRLEEQTPNLSYLKCNSRTLLLITNYFEHNGLLFPNKETIALKKYMDSNIQVISENDLTRFQLKTARIAMRLSQKLLGEYIGLSQSTLSELEGAGNNTDFIKCDEIKVKYIKSFFIKNGIFFPDHFSVELIDDPIIIKSTKKTI